MATWQGSTENVDREFGKGEINDLLRDEASVD